MYFKLLLRSSIFTLSFLILILPTAPAFALKAVFPLEIINIKPAGTGDPAIPPTNRIFRAYPGIEYNIRAAVIGGLFPFRYELSNAPEGMSINPKTGEISWPNPQRDSGNITLTVTDSEGSKVSTSWAIRVTTDGFIFLDSKYTGPQTGSIEKPFNSILSMAQNTTQLDEFKIVYFRGGNYKFELYRADGGGPRMLLWDRPHIWIGYPGEEVNISGDNAVYGRFYSIYLDSLNFSNFVNTGVMFSGGRNYNTIRRTNWKNIVATTSINNNQGFIYATSGGPGSYLTIQDNILSEFTGASAIGSLYDSRKALLENNHISKNGGGGLTNINAGMALKTNLDYLTIRGNKVVMTNQPAFGTNMNSQLADTTDVEVSFNYFEIKSDLPNTVHSLNGYGYAPYDRSLFNFHYHRNTVVGGIGFLHIDGANCSRSGPYNIYNNVIVNQNIDRTGSFRTKDFISYGWDTANLTTSPWLCINDFNNLKGHPSENLLDQSGAITLKFQQYQGTHGHLPNPKSPKGLIINSIK